MADLQGIPRGTGAIPAGGGSDRDRVRVMFTSFQAIEILGRCQDDVFETGP